MLRRIVLLAALLALTLGQTPAGAEEFYKDKTLRMLVGFSPGGGYDTYTRYIARYIGKVHSREPDARGSEHAGRGEPDHRHVRFQAGQTRWADPGGVEPGADLRSRHGRQEGEDRTRPNTSTSARRRRTP